MIAYPAFSQDVEADATALKKRRAELWYADSSFVSVSQTVSTKTSAGRVRARVKDNGLLQKVTTPLGYLLGALILGALAYAFYDFAKTSKKKGGKHSKRESTDKENPEDLHEADYISLVREAEAAGDFRLALRYHYQALLQELSRQSLIRYEKNKTNQQYAEEIKKHKWGKAFLQATRYYNFVWYGDHPLNEESYGLMAAHFQKMPPYATAGADNGSSRC